jgi:hypothetical protein
MKSARRSLKLSAQVFQRHIPESAFSAEHPGGESGKAATKRTRQAADLERVLHMSQQLYAHALTLQEVIRSEGQVTYEALRPRFDRQAAQQFELLYPSKRHSEARVRSAARE